MKPRLKSSPAARDLIKRFEPFRDTAERGADGRWVVGYGHRAAARAGIKVSEEEAALLLIYDVMRAEDTIDELTSKPLARGQRDAMISFVHDVGAEAFRNSDVARYLFEGRMEAAGEALAAYGDGNSARREAEASMFLDALLPSARRSQPVELVIKVEHPSEERVLEGAIAGSGRQEPVEDYVPPPPMPDRTITSRREAEAEIARILATVEAMPLEEREALVRGDEDAFAPMEDVVAEMSDAPVEGRYEAVEEIEAEADEATADDTDAIPPAQAREGGEPAAAAAENAAARVAARMAQEIDDDIDTPVESVAKDAAVLPAEQPIAETGDNTAEARPQIGFGLPAGTELGFTLTRIPEQVVVATAEPRGDTAVAEPLEPRSEYSLDLPEGSTLGYVFSTVMTGRFQPRADTAPAPASDAQTDTLSASEPSAEEDDETAVVEIVERAVASAGDETPPPHPAVTPAQSVGAVGEVEAEQSGEEVTAPFEVDADDPMMEGRDPLTGEDEFSPSDLAADIHPAPEKPLTRTDDGGWGFLASFMAGLVVSGFGLVSTWGDWARMWSERSLTGDGWVLVAGVFLMLVSAWFLGSVWLERLKRNKRDTAKVQ